MVDWLIEHWYVVLAAILLWYLAHRSRFFYEDGLGTRLWNRYKRYVGLAFLVFWAWWVILIWAEKSVVIGPVVIGVTPTSTPSPTNTPRPTVTPKPKLQGWLGEVDYCFGPESEPEPDPFPCLEGELYALSASPPSIPGEEEKLLIGTIAYVIDGDTIKMETGQEVQLIGIDGPEPGQPCSDESKCALEGMISEDAQSSSSDIFLFGDVQETDQYGRLLAYVAAHYVPFVNLEMVLSGYAKAMRAEPNTYYADAFSLAEYLAGKEIRGCWGIYGEAW